MTLTTDRVLAERAYAEAKAAYDVALLRLRKTKQALAALPLEPKPRTPLAPMARLRGDKRIARDRMLGKRVDDGASIEALAAEFHIDPLTVRRAINWGRYREMTTE